ncbi:dATP/dGTP pyrophosphohydrolase domain-containing protein, partial [Citrobacter freundii]|nr:dATP/dGTP pyrophosphohydrolase domain-containing protein [Citrobacter freundii]
DAQRRAGITDEQITLAMVEKLAMNKQREWPEPKDGVPRLHIKELSESVLPGIECDICGHVSTDPEGRHYCCEDNS